MIHASTFSGIGAAEIAAEMLGWSNAFHCEINPFGRQVLDYWFPNSISYEDITKTDFSEWRGKIDVLTGGFPCQPFSYAGKRRGSEDDRYLWPFMLKCIQQVRPTWFVGENVGGIATMVFPGQDVEMGKTDSLFEEGDLYRTDERFVIEEICESLEREGYSVQPMLVPACSVGSPHRRDRIFFIAHRNEFPLADTDCGDDGGGKSGKFQGEEREERICERDNIRESVKPTDVRSEMQGVVDDSCSKGLEGKNEPGSEEGGKRMHIRRDFAGYPMQNLQPEERWKSFPTVSPIHRRNDGIPFDVDCLSIPFGKWREESLKAYGNAIVVQVIYEIFRAIDQIDNPEDYLY